MSNRFLRFGQGRISGYVSAFLGVMSFLTVLCFLYPSYLTTTELRSVYDPDEIRLVLRIGICVSLGFGLLTFAMGRRKRMGAVGVLFTLASLVHGADAEATRHKPRLPGARERSANNPKTE